MPPIISRLGAIWPTPAQAAGSIQGPCLARNTIACDCIMRRPYASGGLSSLLRKPTAWTQKSGRKRLTRGMQPRSA
jgi:hypothetical protein